MPEIHARSNSCICACCEDTTEDRIIYIIPDQVLAHLADWNTSARNRKQDNIKESTWSVFLEGRAESQNLVSNRYS